MFLFILTDLLLFKVFLKKLDKFFFIKILKITLRKLIYF